MVFDIENEELLTFAQLAKALSKGRGNRGIHVATVHRWRAVGVAGGIRLEAIRVGGTWRTTWSAFRQFCDRLTASKSDSVQSPAGSKRSVVEANKKLSSDNW